MANNLATNTWKIDTASATTVKVGLVKVNSLEFSNYGGAGDEAIITATDAAGNIVPIVNFRGDANGDVKNTSFGESVWMRNLAVPTLTSGQVTVYLG